MKKYFNKNVLLVLSLLFNMGKIQPMALFKAHTFKKTTSSIYPKNNIGMPLHKIDTKNIHIFKKINTKQPLTHDMHKKAYQLSLHHEFPTAPHYNKHYNPTTCETKSLQNALAKENSEIEAFWIPKTLYELFVIYEHENSYTEYKGYTGELENSNFEELLMINQHTKNIHLHKQINDAILTFLQQHPQQKTQTEESYFINLAENIICQLPVKFKDLKDEILKAISEEYSHHKYNPETFLLYRSGPLDKRDFNPYANYALNHTKKEHSSLPEQISLSFGAGFFTAYYTDRGACAATIFCKIEKPYSYIFPINKKDTLENKNSFFVPPLGPITSFFSQGEAFHARTKTAGYVIKPDGWCTWKNPFPKVLSENIRTNYLTGSTKQNAYYKKLYTNLIQKAIPLNKPTEHAVETLKNMLPEE